MGAEHLVQSPGPSAAAADTARASSWAPHGRALTACLVALNVFLVLLVYVYFWRFFSRAPPRGRGDEEDAAASSEEDGSSPPASPKARDVERAITALPVFVHASSDSDSSNASTECAICIAEFADGEEGRLLPRCGHRFHARCVDTWFRAHTTCPLCRDTVLHVAGRDAHTKEEEAAVTTTTTTTANRSSDTDTSSDCPV